VTEHRVTFRRRRRWKTRRWPFEMAWWTRRSEAVDFAYCVMVLKRYIRC